MRIFRLHRRQRPPGDYGGSLLYPGRWNVEGTALIYASSSLALACLEILVHIAPSQIPVDYVYSIAHLDRIPEIADYRGDLADESATRRFGHSWSTQGYDLAIRVPSLIIPIEENVLINPLHSDFSGLTWAQSEPFKFDSRLVRV